MIKELWKLAGRVTTALARKKDRRNAARNLRTWGMISVLFLYFIRSQKGHRTIDRHKENKNKQTKRKHMSFLAKNWGNGSPRPCSTSGPGSSSIHWQQQQQEALTIPVAPHSPAASSSPVPGRAAATEASFSLPSTQDHRRARPRGFYSPVLLQKVAQWHHVAQGSAFHIYKWHQQGLRRNLYWFARVAITKHHRLDGLNNRLLFLTVLEAENLRSRSWQGPEEDTLVFPWD